MKYFKYETLGNSVLVIVDVERMERSLVKRLCTKDLGLAVNRIILFKSLEKEVLIYDENGDELSCCLDSVRALASYLKRCDSSIEEFTIKTKKANVYCRTNSVEEVEISIDKYSLKSSDVPVDCRKQKFLKEVIIIDQVRYDISSMNVVDANTAVFTKIGEKLKLEKIGRVISKSPIFFEGTNVCFINVVSKEKLDIKTYINNKGFGFINSHCLIAGAYFSYFYGKSNKEVKVLSGEYEVNITIDDRLTIYAPVMLIASGELHF